MIWKETICLNIKSWLCSIKVSSLSEVNFELFVNHIEIRLGLINLILGGTYNRIMNFFCLWIFPLTNYSEIHLVWKGLIYLFNCLQIGADGVKSSVRKASNLHTMQWKYNQTALVATMKLAEVSWCFILTPPQNCGGVIFSLQFVCLCVCVCVCLSVCEQNADRTATPILTLSSLNSCLLQSLEPYWNWWPLVKDQGHSDGISIFPS